LETSRVLIYSANNIHFLESGCGTKDNRILRKSLIARKLPWPISPKIAFSRWFSFLSSVRRGERSRPPRQRFCCRCVWKHSSSNCVCHHDRRAESGISSPGGAEGARLTSVCEGFRAERWDFWMRAASTTLVRLREPLPSPKIFHNLCELE
jgi:hypothetical protein